MDYMILNMFGALLAKKRIDERRPISLREVSKATGIPYKTLYAWQNNTVTRYDAHIMDAICRYFECQPAHLFVYTSEVPHPKKGLRELGIKAVLTAEPDPDDELPGGKE